MRHQESFTALARPMAMVCLSLVLTLACGACTASTESAGGAHATGDSLKLLLRIQLEDGSTARGHEVFLRTPEPLSSHELAILEAEWNASAEGRYGVFLDSEGEWWWRIEQSNPDSSAPQSYFVSSSARGASLEQFYTLTGDPCRECSKTFMIRLNDERTTDTSGGLWETEPGQWRTATIDYDRASYLHLVEQAAASADEPECCVAVPGAVGVAFGLAVRHAGASFRSGVYLRVSRGTERWFSVSSRRVSAGFFPVPRVGRARSRVAGC